MKVILLTEVEKLGGPGDIVKARDGYARNYLIPYSMAKAATPENIAEVEKQKQALQAEVNKVREAANARREALDGLVVPVEVGTKDGVELYGPIGVAEIVKYVGEAAKQEVHKNEVIISEGAIRKVGEHQIVIHLHTDINATVTLAVSSTGEQEAAPDESAESSESAAPEAEAAEAAPASKGE